jgi:hypothetical protein
MHISVPYGGQFRIFRVVHVEPMPPFVVNVVGTNGYINQVAASSYADTPSDVRELKTHDNEIFILDYIQPQPALFGVGIGGAENRPMKEFISLPDLYYPPSGEVPISANLSANTPTVLVAPPAFYAQLPQYRVRALYVANSGTSAATVTLNQVLGSATTQVFSAVVPAGGNAYFERLYIPVYGALQAVASAAVSVTAVIEWLPMDETARRPTVNVGLGQSIYMRIVNPLTTTLTSLQIIFSGVRYRVFEEGIDKTARGEIVTIFPFS